jgi:hypothetical protein
VSTTLARVFASIRVTLRPAAAAEASLVENGSVLQAMGRELAREA